MAIWHKLTREHSGKTECGLELWIHWRTKATMKIDRVECPKCKEAMNKRKQTDVEIGQ